MIVERNENEILVRFPAGTSASKIQSILDYLRYEELTAKSNASIKDLEKIVKESKINRWNKIKKEIGYND
ncbi:hypothetical protein [Marivirga sp.]|uniref:hypothetical protein n=1 Tax=Marivirga sp. TaxID=2018662 RepID=UPI003DA75AAD